MGDSLDVSVESTTDSQNVSVVDFDTFINYLRKSVSILHPDEEIVPNAFSLALEEKSNQECIKKFLNDSQVWALSIQRISVKGILNFHNIYILFIIFCFVIS